MVQAGCGFSFETKPLEMRFVTPVARPDDLQRDRSIQTFLPGSIDHCLTTPADLVQQLVIIELAKVRPAFLHPLLGLAIERADCGVEQAQTAKPLRGVGENPAS